MKWPQFLTFPRKPDFTIGSNDDIYLQRWFVIPRNNWCNIYLHKFLRSDDERALHDHPWANASILLSGKYVEITQERKERCYFCAGTGNLTADVKCARCHGSRFEPARLIRTLRKPWRPWAPWRVAVRRAETMHRVQLVLVWATETAMKEAPVWTLFITGPRVREWGFDCPQGWRHWTEYVEVTPGGNKLGKGCE